MKIYYDKKSIILKEFSDNGSMNPDNIKVFAFQDNKQLIEIFDSFFEKEEMQEIIILHSDKKDLLNNIKFHFKHIEAAGGVVFNDKNEVLIIERFGIPDLPKGKTEKGESVEETAKREVEEECGISGLKIVQELESSFHIYTRKNERILKRTYWFEMKYSGNEKLVPQLEEEIENAEFISKDKIKDLTEKTYCNLRDIFKYIINRTSSV